VEGLKAPEVLACSEKFLKGRFIITGKSAITLYMSLVLTEKINF